MPLRLVSVAMTEDELATVRRRRGYWLRLARERANMDQNSVARELGMSPKSGTSVLAWEKGVRSPTMDQLDQLARIYGVPVSTFSEPRPTDEEWLAGLALGAVGLALTDLEEGAARSHDDGEPPAAQPRRQSA
jgi:transcriptional regulator with XRE-family HTH domain